MWYKNSLASSVPHTCPQKAITRQAELEETPKRRGEKKNLTIRVSIMVLFCSKEQHYNNTRYDVFTISLTSCDSFDAGQDIHQQKVSKYFLQCDISFCLCAQLLHISALQSRKCRGLLSRAAVNAGLDCVYPRPVCCVLNKLCYARITMSRLQLHVWHTDWCQSPIRK